MPTQRNTIERRQNRRYMRDFVPAMVAYGITIATLVALVDPDSDSTWNVVWWLLPVVPAAFVVRAVYRSLQDADEYQRELQLQALAAGFGAAMLAALTVGFLDVSWDPRIGGWIVYSVGMLTWGLTAAFRAARG